jgi:hypothetical protein
MDKPVLVVPGITDIAFEREHPLLLVATSRLGSLFRRTGIGLLLYVRRVLSGRFVTGSSTVYKTGNFFA